MGRETEKFRLAGTTDGLAKRQSLSLVVSMYKYILEIGE